MVRKGTRKQKPTVPKPPLPKPTLKFGIFELGDIYSRLLREHGLDMDLMIWLQNLIGVEWHAPQVDGKRKRT